LGAVPRFAVPAALLAAALLGSGCSLGDDDGSSPALGVKSGDSGAAAKLGFPASATRNTIRVGGDDPVSDAAGVANAIFPSTGAASRPTAVALVDRDDWQSAVAAAVLAAPPIAAPLLLSDGGDLPAVTEQTLKRLKPRGSDLSKDAHVLRIGPRPPKPDGFKTLRIEGDDPYERAAAVDRFATSAKGRPSANVIVASGEKAEWAMPAAAWAARSGDAILLTKRDELPAATRRALRAHERPAIWVLGPSAAVSPKVFRELRRHGAVRRIQGPTPVQSAIAFARFQRGGFGWGVVVPGYNFTLANTNRPADAAAAALLATRGVFAPLLVTDRADELPRPLESYMLSVQPGYEDDPGQAVYNRVWILGDKDAVSVEAQARLDQVTELIPVQTNAP
jgi:hypothetical protein